MIKIIIYFIFCFLQTFCCFNCVGRNLIPDKDADSDNTSIFPYTLKRSSQELLKFFNQTKIKLFDGVQELIDIYNRAKVKKDQYDQAGKIKKYPLIVLEGLSGSGKTTISAALATKINGTSIHSPPKNVEYLRNKFINDTLLDNAYHQFAHYITALEANVLLNDSPVVLDRYWHSSATYYMARLLLNYPEKYSLPSKGDIAYNWPEDLFKPDLVLFLEIDENIRIKRINGRIGKDGNIERKFGKNQVLLQNCPDYRKNVLLAYKNMQNPEITLINDNLSIQEVLEECFVKVKPFLN